MASKKFLGLLLIGMPLLLPVSAHALTVAAGDSFKAAFTELAASYEKQTGVKVTFRFGPSSALAKQVGEGGIDIVACAMSWADRLQQDGKLDAASRTTFLSDHLILVAPASSTATWTPGTPLTPLLDGGSLALADPESSQTGQYSKRALISLDLWDDVAPKVLKTASIRDALAAVADHKAVLGLVYQTDLQNGAPIHVVGRLPDDSHPPIAYSFALTREAGPEARNLLTFLESDTARAAYVHAGFEIHPLSASLQKQLALRKGEQAASTRQDGKSRGAFPSEHFCQGQGYMTAQIVGLGGVIQNTVGVQGQWRTLIEDIRGGQRDHAVAQIEAAVRTHVI
jgi:molybdate transport system substrate-binding protein